MTDRVIPKDALLAIIAGLTGLTPGATVWALDPRPFVNPTDDRAQVTLEVFSMSAMHVDEHRRYLSDGNDGYPAGTWWVQEIGNRTVTITIRAEAFDRSAEASEILDRIRTAIRADDVTAKLNAINVAYVWSQPAIRLPTMYDNRVVNAATADFQFACIASFVSKVILPGVGGDYIATVNMPPENGLVPGDFS